MGQCAAYMIRSSLSITIVAMVTSNSSNSTSDEEGDDDDVCPNKAGGNDTDAYVEGEFDWDEKTQGLLLSSFFYGYVTTNFLGGLAVEYFSGRLVFGLSILLSALLSLLSPICAKTSLELFITIMVMTGIAQGPIYPAIHAMTAARIPVADRTKYNSIILTGSHWGIVISMALGGVLSSSNFLGGWPSVYYVFGSVGVLWSVLWFFLVEKGPKELHPASCNEGNASTLRFKDINWKNIFLSTPFWCLLIFGVGDSFGAYTLWSEIPTYLSNIQHFNLQKNGFTSSLPYILMIFFSIFWGLVANYLILNNKISVLNTRRLSTAVGMYSAAIALVVMCFVNCNSTLAVVVLCVGVSVTGASNSGGSLGEQDMCPPSIVGVIKGITNTFSSSMGAVAPLVTGAIISGNETLSAWRTVFIIAAVVYCVSCTFYLIFITDKKQPWKKI